MSGGYAHDEIVDIVVGRPGGFDAVELQEHRRREPSEPLVAVDQRVILDQGLEQGPRLEPEIRIGVVTKGARRRTGGGGAEESQIPYRGWITQQEGSQGQ